MISILQNKSTLSIVLLRMFYFISTNFLASFCIFLLFFFYFHKEFLFFDVLEFQIKIWIIVSPDAFKVIFFIFSFFWLGVIFNNIFLACLFFREFPNMNVRNISWFRLNNWILFIDL